MASFSNTMFGSTPVIRGWTGLLTSYTVMLSVLET